MERIGFKHAAEEGDEEMSPEAAHAGRSSMLSQERPGMSVLMLYASFYHRLPLFRPSTRSIGIGCSGRDTSIDGITRREPRAWQYPILVSSSEQPANPKRPDNRKSICLLPRSPLRPKTSYSVEVTYKRNGEEERKRWVFKTGRRRPVWGPPGRQTAFLGHRPCPRKLGARLRFQL